MFSPRTVIKDGRTPGVTETRKIKGGTYKVFTSGIRPRVTYADLRLHNILDDVQATNVTCGDDFFELDYSIFTMFIHEEAAHV